MTLQAIDVVILILLIIGFIWGFGKGFLYMFFSLLGIVFGILAGVKLPPLIFSLFKVKFEFFHLAIGFLIIFLSVYSVFVKISNSLGDILENMDLTWVDSLMGGIIGTLQLSILTGLVVNLLTHLNIAFIIKESKTSLLLPIFNQLFAFLTTLLSQKIS